MNYKNVPSTLLGALAIYGFAGVAIAEQLQATEQSQPITVEAVEAVESIATVEPNAAQKGEANTNSVILDEVQVYAPAIESDVLISQQQFNKKSPSTLAEIFDNTPGVGVGGGELPMAQKIFIRGMDDIMLNVMVDGASRNGEIFHHQSRIAINPDILKAVEVNAGVSSALNGPGGLGGNVNFVTKSPYDLLATEQKFGGTAKVGYDSTNDGLQTNLNVFGTITDSVGYLFSITNNSADSYENGKGESTKYTDFNQLDLYGKIDAFIGESQNLILSVNKLTDNGKRNERTQFDIDYRGAGTPVDQEFSTSAMTANYSIETDILNLEATLHSSDSELKMTRADDSTLGGTNKTIGFDVRNAMDVQDHLIVGGFDLNSNTSTPLNDAYTQWAQQAQLNDPSAVNIPQSMKSDEALVIGLYVQDKWQALESLVLDFGTRLDFYSLNDNLENEHKVSGFSPNLSAVYSVTNNFDVFASGAHVVRGVGAKEALLIDYPGPTPPIPGFTAINFTNVYVEDIEAEKTNTFEIGSSFVIENYSIKINVFQTEIQNFVGYLGRELAVDANGDSTTTWLYNTNDNIGDASMSGFELSVGYKNETISIQANVSDSAGTITNEAGEERVLNDGDFGLGTTVGMSSNLAVDYYINSMYLTLGLNTKHAQEESYDMDGTEIVKEAYLVHDLYLSWNPKKVENLNLKLNIDNVTNEYYFDHTTYHSGTTPNYGLAEAGLNVGLTASYKF
ncbi:TonB-dependent receptor domain-containing protein [Marinicellulosiphila megalodicopiae]|uniref:TonB-dependent receptor domain-containing protein n=1 Tax=Marinicellulosiphila megalodicopiae TaxID=2724896 RepID=UPI003BB0E81C